MKKNMGTADRIIRVMLAAVIVGLCTFQVVTGILAVMLLFVGGVILLTSIVSFCPIYSPLKISTRKKQNR